MKMRRSRRKRPSLKNNLENRDGDCITSTCTLPMEHSNTWLDDSSRASSRCTYHGQRDSRDLTEIPFLPKPLLAEETSLVLSPHINVIPETMSMRAGQQHLWAAIEVCGRLLPANDRPGNGRVSCLNKGWWSTFPLSILRVVLEYRQRWKYGTLTVDTDTSLTFGYLYDLTIDVLPTTQSSIVQTICQQSFPT